MLKEGVYYKCWCGLRCLSVVNARKHRREMGPDHTLHLTCTPEYFHDNPTTMLVPDA